MSIEALKFVAELAADKVISEREANVLRQAIAEQENKQVLEKFDELKQKPMAWINAGHEHELRQNRLPYAYVYRDKGVGVSVPVYTSPPQRQWVGLTDEQFLELILRKGTQELVGVTTCVSSEPKKHGQIALLRSAKIIKEFVEAAHGIKENT